MSAYPKSLLSGLAGAVAVTLLNESVRRVYGKAPRLEKLGMDAAGKSLDAAGLDTPPKEALYWGTMAADIASNTLYYSLINIAAARKGGKWALGAGLGLAAGIGAVMLPAPMHLDASTTNRSPKTKALTVAWYLTGALIATGVVSLLTRDGDE